MRTWSRRPVLPFVRWSAGSRSAAVAIAAAIAVPAALGGCRHGSAPDTQAAELSPGVAYDPAHDWAVPEGWKSETIPFPLEFAPSLAHRGVEELRFAPGMFDAAAPGYWSYAFVWWLEDPELQDAASLGAELTAYFRGLLTMVADERAKKAAAAPAAGAPPPPPPIDAAAISATVRVEPDAAGWQRFTGEATVVDSFGDGRRLALRLVIAQHHFSALGRRAVLVLASPADAGQPIWRQLEQVAVSFDPPDP
jgi:hypothetical protein